MNAILRNCGRSIIQSKLADLEQRFGVAATEVNPAYTSQTCSACGYVDRRNRPSQSRFKCLWCGREMHADLNAASNVGERRARLIGSVFQSKAAILAELVRAGSGSDGCGPMARVEPGAGVLPPTRDCPIPTSVGEASRVSGVRSDRSTRFGARYVNLIVPKKALPWQ